MNLLYLHGFNSSPDSTKAKIFQSFVRKKKSENLLVPALPISPKETILLLEEIIEDHKKKISLIGRIHVRREGFEFSSTSINFFINWKNF